MSGEPLRYNFIFTPPQDDAACWNLDLSAFANKLRESFPDSSDAQAEGELGARPAQALSFEIALTEGDWLDGMVSTPFPKTGSVVLYLATPLEGAAFAKWLRDVLVPEGVPIEVMSSLALENGVEDVRRVPASGELADIAEGFDEHVAFVEAALG